MKRREQPAEIREHNVKTLFVSLGCDKNTVDTRKMAGILEDGGLCSFTEDENQAEAAVVNTCAFIDSAKQESIDEILSVAQLKNTAKLKYLVVTGCLAQRYQDEILKLIPEVDAVVGTTAEDSIGQVLEALEKGQKPEKALLEHPDLPPSRARQVMTLGSFVGYLKIAEGCNKNCTYCAIPSIRGHYRSVPMEQILEDAKDLARQGAQELILVAQETTLYGTDLYGEKCLPELLRRLCLVQGIQWIRVLYCYPEEITDDLIQVLAEENKVVPYLDMPIQHASDHILRRMGRRTNRQELETMVRRLRERVPGICLRTTLITGFPGETEEDHKSLLQFVRDMEFDRLGVYAYSREERTPAAGFDGQVHPSTKKRRRKELMLAQQEIAFRRQREQVGKETDVLIEGRLADEMTENGYVYVGRTAMDAPDVDSCIYLETARDLMSGTLVRARITGSKDYDLLGGLADEFTE